ncbi:hypothetical protein [Aeromicrobium ginsengisoli]|uniref:hypothetical protein n=1 Tax=Aeromicrobium ginsengisoli TaxID=363867 RepID=UPI00165FAE01|nr:hypothetical protein [Aeromicrobium ginsengisoli]
MNHLIVLVLLALAFAALAVVLVRTLRGDGYGLRPPPRSHREEVDLHSRYRSLV